MNKKILNFSLFSLLLALLFSCGSDEGNELLPGSFSNIRYEAREGAVMLKWDVPADSNYHYLKVMFNDPWKKKERAKLASIYTDSLLIDGMLNRFGKYTLSIQPYSKSHTPGKISTFEVSCDPLPASYTVLSEKELPLTKANLYTNAQEPSEGPIENLLDDDGSTFFHSTWSGTSPAAPHYLQLNFSAPLKEQGFKFKFRNRANGSNKPVAIDVLISEDGEKFTKIATIDEDLPVSSGSEYTSSAIFLAGHFQPKHIRFNVVKTNTGTVFFTMADFWFYECVVGVDDPENDKLK
jgi:hypothetical protein